MLGPLALTTVLLLFSPLLISAVTLPCPAKPPCKCSAVEDHKDPHVAFVQIVTCESDVFPQLKDIGNDTFFDVALRIENSNFKVIPTGALKHLSPRPVIQISRNPNLVSIESGALFVPKVSLMLIKDNPYLKTIHPGAFRSPDKPTKHLSNGSDAGAISIRTLVLIADELTNLQPGTFEGLENFDGFTLLQFDRLQELSAGVFRGLKSLKQLEIRTGYQSQTKLVIRAGAFNGLYETFCNCCLTNSVKVTGAAMIEADAFANATSLSYLSLNNVVRTEGGVLRGLNSIRQFELNNEQLTVISQRVRTHMGKDFFADLPQLESIMLLKISSSFHVSDEIFEPLDQLETLQISQVSLAALPNSIKSLKELSSLVISRVPLSARGLKLFADQINSLSNLETLQIVDVPLTDASVGDLSGAYLPHLTQLSVRCGRFDSLPINITTFPCLQQWQMTNCREIFGQPEMSELTSCQFTEPCALRSWGRFNKKLVQMVDSKCKSGEVPLDSYLRETAKLCNTHETNTELPYCQAKDLKEKLCDNSQAN